mmetsp:Transcript_15553/g.26359  ORF Transcript_15553/g.26359 Transcript_15553/m.26359 type:complete len:206 (+) Transcript_15553:826-1443(+)
MGTHGRLEHMALQLHGQLRRLAAAGLKGFLDQATAQVVAGPGPNVTFHHLQRGHGIFFELRTEFVQVELRCSGGVRDLRPLGGPFSPQPSRSAGRAARRLLSLLAVVTGDVGARRCAQGRGTTGSATGGGWSSRRHHWKLQMLEARLTWSRLRTPGHIAHRSCVSDREGGWIDQDDDLVGLRHHGHLAQIRHLSSRCHCSDTERD